MDLKLVKSPSPWLEKKVEPFPFMFLDAKKTADAMISLMLKEGGVGLSANQVSINAQIFVMKPFLAEVKEPFAVIDPIILRISEESETMPEGCLSHPNLFLKVKRPKSLVAKFLDTDGNECIIELYDIDARCFLHEYDHLHGIEFTDRVSKLKLSRARKKKEKITRKHNG